MVTDVTLSRFWGELLLYATSSDQELREYIFRHPTTRYRDLPNKFQTSAERLLRKALTSRLPGW